MLACFGMDESKVLILDMRSPGQPVAELVGHQAALGGIAWGAGGANTASSGGGWIASCGMCPLFPNLDWRSRLTKTTGDDSQLLLYDLTGPLPSPETSKQSHSTKPSRPARPSPSPYSLSPPTTPAALNRNTPSPGLASEILPTKAWTGDGEINNLAFSDSGDRLGCVSGSKLTVLAV